MKKTNKWLWNSLFFSQIIGCLSLFIWWQIPFLSKVESSFRDRLLRTNTDRDLVADLPIEIVNLNSLNLRNLDDSSRHTCQLIEFLLITAKAHTIVFNVPHSFVEQANRDNFCLLNLIKTKVIEKVILVGYTKPLSQGDLPTISDYNYLNPFHFLSAEYQRSSKGNVGFFEYQPRFFTYSYLNSPARQIFLHGLFFNIVRHRQQKINHFSLLALQNFPDFNNQNNYHKYQNLKQVGFQYFGSTNTFSDTGIEEICPKIDNCTVADKFIDRFQNKIVIVGISDLDHPVESSLSMNSIWNKPMPNVEIQANIIASFLTNKIYYPTDRLLESIIILLLGTLATLSCYLFVIKNSNLSLVLFFIIIFSYTVLAIILFYSGYFIAIFEPILVYSFIGIFTFIYLKYRQKKQWVQSKLEELEKIKRTEENAALTTAKKLLQRVAIDIHDGPLQELKLAMDDLELVQFDRDDDRLDLVLNRLENMARNIRLELHSTTQLAEKMGISPQLKQGLSNAIELTLDELIQTNKLSIRVIKKIEKLNEPLFNSNWLAQREDIFRFFKEAINNIIKHAQPPLGTADIVSVSLYIKEKLACLIVENNGRDTVKNLVKKTTNSAGYGTKMMKTIASDLPEGQWHREYLKSGGVRVVLKWNMNYFFTDGNER